MSSARRDSVAFTVVVTVAVVVGALLMLLILALSGAPGIMLLATALAALPVGPLVAVYLWLDRYEPEPRLLLAYALLWGAFVATIAALVVQGVGGFVVGVTDNVSLAVVAPLTEEASKGFFLLLLLWWRRAELDGVLDGLVYAGLVGVGFAFTENILYLAAAYGGTDGTGPGGVAGVTTIFVVRCVFSPFAHPLFTAFIGVGLGIAVMSRTPAVRILAPIGGYLCAVAAHGLWNGSTVFGFGSFVVGVRRPDGPRLRRHDLPRRVGAHPRAADAHHGPRRRRGSRPDPGDRHRLAGRPPCPPDRAPPRPNRGR